MKIALVCMPFFTFSTPSIQVGLLHAIAARAGFQVDSYHLNLHFAARIGQKAYQTFSMHRGHLTAEWFFSKAAFGKKNATSAEVFFSKFPSELKEAANKGIRLGSLSKIRDHMVPLFLNDCFRIVDWKDYQVVGFTSTFQQNVASLALARRIKKRYPHIKILFGGANMEGEMGVEYLRAFSFIDYVCTGEGDLLLPALLEKLSASDDNFDDIRGLAYRSNGNIKVTGPCIPLNQLDSLPTPDYDEYFRRFQNLNLKRLIRGTFIPLETARGCWWGEKHHCTFCGLNGLTMKFRSKSPDRVLAEVSELSNKYSFVQFSTTDNILDLKYFQTLFAKTRSSGKNYIFAWEMKANLTREQLRNLYLGGMRQIQPGIESLSTHVLSLMRKGCTMLQNLVTLKWCTYYNIDVVWNLLYGFPGETKEDYDGEFSVLKLISHFQPANHIGRIWLERFAPYYFDREAFGISNVKPEASFEHVYPGHVSLEKIAYFFDYEAANTLPDDVHRERLKWVCNWQQRWRSGKLDFLTFSRNTRRFSIRDRRSMFGRDRTFLFEGNQARVYEYCSDTFHSFQNIHDYLTANTGSRCDEKILQGWLDSFCSKGLMVTEEGKYFSLALPDARNNTYFTGMLS